MCTKYLFDRKMDSNSAKCFICDTNCVAKCTNQGLYIAQTLTMPLISVLTKCLRTFVEVENEYFCCECVGKIAEYDKLAKLSLDIEADLYRQYQNKPFRSSFLDDEFIVDQNEIREKISDFFNFKPNAKSRNSGAKTTTVVDEIDLTTSPSDAAADDDEQESNETVDVVADDALEFINQIEQNQQNEETDQSDPSENEDEELSENSELKSKESENDDRSDDAAEKNVQSTSKEQANIVKKRKTKRGRKRKIETKNNNNNNNNIQSGDPTRIACHICGRTYKSKGALGTHMVKHSDNNPHACTICKKVFTQRLGLLRHIPIHTGEQQHQCEVCGKRFIHSASYNMHKKMHLDERSKKCNICGAEFRSSSHMTRHKRSHSGERPFECDICGQKFSQRYNMNTHRNTHRKIKNEVKSFKCLICPDKFLKNREKLNEHLRQVHEAAMIAE